ncbi:MULTISPECIES: metallopeptidase family protein [unclassified Curtobacterium]|uniref:metallopeptidase family protein n=1 Tax=unclassified Curtobacterium TaxID=257496 RepID=UPI000DA9EAB4|nr:MULTISPECIES: metallopeptidase family protein [unclassified Curtobacterium]MDN3478973.1 metallopeptidase family protein [Curtobacterium sp. APC 4022]MDN4646954.1 metallopeptidase family protein [Curtobacterium sp. PsM8]MDY1004997.1 metallopeptidase family protein [Curtobacterium sp. CFBP9011]WIE60282.1 metallopeptidase family protein [Curtobacterium sp. MCLR17_032]
MRRKPRIVTPVDRARGRSRHGRGHRSSVTGPELAPVITRAETFDRIVGDTAHYLVGLWPGELAGVVFQVADMPTDTGLPDELPRWRIERDDRRVTVFRIPVERVTHSPEKDDVDRRIVVETAVFRAVAELLDKDPWDLAPDRYRHW